MGKYFRISSYIRKPFLIYDFATAPLWNSSCMRKSWFTLPERSDWAEPAPSCRPSVGWLATCSRTDPWSSCTHTQRWNLHYACATLCRHSAQLADNDLSVRWRIGGQLLARQNFYIIKGSAYGYTASHSCIIHIYTEDSQVEITFRLQVASLVVYNWK